MGECSTIVVKGEGASFSRELSFALFQHVVEEIAMFANISPDLYEQKTSKEKSP